MGMRMDWTIERSLASSSLVQALGPALRLDMDPDAVDCVGDPDGVGGDLEGERDDVLFGW